MSESAITVCVLDSSGDADRTSADVDTLLLSLAAQRLAAMCGLVRVPAIVSHDDLEAKLLAGDRVIVLAAMPRPLAIDEKVQDFILASDTLAFLLSHPTCFVLFISGMDRHWLDDELAAWSVRAGVPTAKREHLATATPLFWSFMTVSELTADYPPSGLYTILSGCAASAIFDPTGLRSFLHILLKGSVLGGPKGRHSQVTPTYFAHGPLFGVVADDEADVAFIHAYHLRRLGYSTLIVHGDDMWNQIIAGGPWTTRAHAYDVLMFDDYMDFQPGEVRIGHALLDGLDAKLKVYVTGLASGYGAEKRLNVVTKPITDAHDLRRKLNRAGAGQLADNLRDCAVGEEPIHLAPASVLRRCARHIVAVAADIERRDRRLEAALHYLEAYHLFNGIDESAAASAFMRFQLLEIGDIASQSPDALDPQFWPDRHDEIRRVLKATFRVHKTEGLWWTARLFQEIEIVMDASLVAADLLLKVDASTTRAVMRLQWRQERRRREHGVMKYLLWLQWLNPFLWLKWGFRVSFALFNSFGRVLASWVLCNLVFAIIYAWLGVRCGGWKGIELLWPARAVIASFGAGAGLAFPQDYGLCLPVDGHLWLGSMQRFLALVFVWKILDLFVTRTRTRA